MMVMPERAGKVYLVGSGPGDVAYLTLQAQAVLSQAEVLVYDALVDGELLTLVPDGCLKLDVGKRGGQPSTPQAEINQILVDYCQQGYLVVRLKNGDPFIFGRSQSEIGALKRANCDFEVVPGLSSSLLAPLMAGIPLTDPRLSPGFMVVSGHDPEILNWVSLAKLDTLVFLMGARTLPEIVRRLRGHGRSPDTPIAVIRYAGRDRQQIWEGTLANILEITANQSLSPCVIVVGEVVKLRAYIGEQGLKQRTVPPEAKPSTDRSERRQRERPNGAPATTAPNGSLGPVPTEGIPRDERSPQRRRPTPDTASADRRDRPGRHPNAPAITNAAPTPSPEPLAPASEQAREPGPLTHKTILVTRAASQSSQFTALLEAQGATVIEMPTLEIGPPSSWRDLDRAISHLEDFDWLILTSANGVEYFFDRLEAVTGERAFSTNIKVAVVGEKTAKTLRRMGIPADFIPPDFVADSLVATFPEPLSGLRILFPRVESGGREVLVKEFSNQGAKVKEVAAYESYCPPAIAPPILVALQAKAIDVITFASSKTVRNFCQLLQAAAPDWPSWVEQACIASIGPQTSQTCQSLLGRVDVEAQEYTLDGLTQAIAEWAARSTPPELETDTPAAETPPEATPELTEPETQPTVEAETPQAEATAPPSTETPETTDRPTIAPPEPTASPAETAETAETAPLESSPLEPEPADRPAPAIAPATATAPDNPDQTEPESALGDQPPVAPSTMAPPAETTAPQPVDQHPPEDATDLEIAALGTAAPAIAPPDTTPIKRPQPDTEPVVIEMEIVPNDPDQEAAESNRPAPKEPPVPPPSAQFAPVIDLEIVSATGRQSSDRPAPDAIAPELIATPIDSPLIPDPWSAEPDSTPPTRQPTATKRTPGQRFRANANPPRRPPQPPAPQEEFLPDPVNGDPDDDSDSNW